MNYKIVTKESFSVIGIAVRTINKEGKSQKDIGQLWETFFVKNIVQSIPNKLGNEIYCIYGDYESDFTGAYTTIIGCRVSSLDEIPDGMVSKVIPEASYKCFKALGPVPDSVGKVWSEIWNSGMDRKYIADFDVYGEKSQDPENPEVDIYVS